MEGLDDSCLQIVPPVENDAKRKKGWVLIHSRVAQNWKDMECARESTINVWRLKKLQNNWCTPCFDGEFLKLQSKTAFAMPNTACQIGVVC